jgi:hypothetical protein
MKNIIVFIFFICSFFPTLIHAKNVSVSFLPLKHVSNIHYTLNCVEISLNTCEEFEKTIQNPGNAKKRLNMLILNMKDTNYLCKLGAYTNINELVYSSKVFRINPKKDYTQPKQEILEIQIY